MADTEVKALLLQVDATIELLRRNLNTADAAVKKSTDGWAKDAGKADGAFANVGKGLNPLASRMRELTALTKQYGATNASAHARATAMQRQIASQHNQIATSLRSSAALVAGAFSVNQLKDYADTYTRFTNQLKVANVSQAQLPGTQNALYEVAQKYGVQLEGIGTLYGRVKQSAGELGASQAELMKFTNGVAAALKIQGGAASETQGALLQLSQALGSPIVRAEEFSSINEGARPILEAVANGIDKYAGSVARLRQDVIDGKLASADFFQGFLRGSAQLEAQAAKSNLTIGASFTILNNALGKYIGESDQALSATERVSSAIVGLSNNLDIIAPALAVLGLSFGVKALAAPFAAGVAEAALFTKALDQQKVVMIGSAVAAAQKAEAVAAGAAREVASIEATIAARRTEQAALVDQIKQEAALAAERRAQAAGAAASNLAGAPRTAAVRAQIKAENDAAFASDRLAAARQRLVAVDGELAVAEGALSGAQARAATTATAAAVATNAATLSARAGAAATSLLTGALTLLGGSTVGGLVVLTLGALVASVMYFSAQSRQAAADIAEFKANGERLNETLVMTSQYGSQAAANVGSVGTQAANATGSMRSFAGAVGDAATALYRLADAKKKEALTQLGTDLLAARKDAAAASAAYQENSQSSSSVSRFGYLPQSTSQKVAQDEAAKRLAEAQRREKLATEEIRRIAKLGNEAFTPSAISGQNRDVTNEDAYGRVTRDLVIARKRGVQSQIDSLEAQKYEYAQYKTYRKQGLSSDAAADAAGKDRAAFTAAADGRQSDKTTAAAKREGAIAARQGAAAARDAAADARAFSAQERQINNDIASARAELSNNIADRAAVEKARIAAELESRNFEIDEQVKQGRFGTGDIAKQRALELKKLNDDRADLEQKIVDRNLREELAREARDIAAAGIENEEDLLRAQLDLTTARGERHDLELQLLNLSFRQQRADIEAAIASETASETQKQIARERLAILDRLKGSAAARIDRDHEGPVEQWKRNARETADNWDENIESMQVQALDNLTSGLADAATEYVKLGGIAGDVVNGIIRDLIRLAAQQAIMSAIGGLTGGGKSKSSTGDSVMPKFKSLLGFSSGGFTGNVPEDQVAGVVHGREYVFDAAATSRIGVEQLDAIRRGQFDLSSIASRTISSMSAPAASMGSGRSTIRLELSGDIRADMVDIAQGVSVEVVRATSGEVIASAKNATIADLSRARM